VATTVLNPLRIDERFMRANQSRRNVPSKWNHKQEFFTTYRNIRERAWADSR